MEAVLGDIAQQAVDAMAKTTSRETATLETEIEAGFAGPFTTQRYGYWVDFKYRFWPRALNNTFLGRGLDNPQLIPIFRLEQIWFNDFVKSFEFVGRQVEEFEKEDLSQLRTTLGLAYRPITSAVITAAWEHNIRRKGSVLIFPDRTGIGRLPLKSYDAFVFGFSFGF